MVHQGACRQPARVVDAGSDCVMNAHARVLRRVASGIDARHTISQGVAVMALLNQTHTRIADVVAARGSPPWIERLVQSAEVVATLICTPTGHSSRRHFHPDNDEFWIVLGGELRWEIDGQPSIVARSGDVVRVPRATAHHIVTISSEPALRLAIGIADIPHVDAVSGEVF